jgi:hypothetical protein
MKKFGKIVLVIALAWWFISAILSVFGVNNGKTIEMFQKANPGTKVETVSSTLSFFDVLLTRDHEWETVWLIDGERTKMRWQRTYHQPIPAGIYFGLGTSWIKVLGFVDD